MDGRETLGEGMVLYVTSDLRPLTCYQRSASELQQAVKTQVSLGPRPLPFLLNVHVGGIPDPSPFYWMFAWGRGLDDAPGFLRIAGM